MWKGEIFIKSKGEEMGRKRKVDEFENKLWRISQMEYYKQDGK